ncbi:MAG: efflux RND transporter periplasmic adaptor subunit [Cytophagales bacterium]|nr:efflux RND transporter periplasmic adaptor subunit [Cytophagales bacterium]
MKKYLIIMVCLFSTHLLAHEGHDHKDEKKDSKQTGKSWFTVTSISEKFELVLRYDPITANEMTEIKLFISDFETNVPTNSAKITITCMDDENLKFTVKQAEPGIYIIEGIFPKNSEYSLVANIATPGNADLMLLEGIEVGKELPMDGENNSEHSGVSWTTILFVIISFITGVIITLFIGKRLKKAIFLLFLTLTIPANQTNNIFAHEGHDHGDEKKSKSSQTLTDAMEILKETQFLFEIRTAFSKYSDYYNTLKLYGKVMPVTNGEALIIAPQNSSIVSINISIGEKVHKGQILVVIEQTLTAAEQIQVATEKSNTNAGFEAAKKEYKRLKSIEDIVAKKDLLEAEIRYQTALKNKKVYDNLSGSSLKGKIISIKSPIKGVVDNFHLAIGQQVSQGELLVTVYNTKILKVEAQIFDKDLHRLHHPDLSGITQNVNFFVECIQEEKHYSESARLIAFGNVVNPVNQSSKVILEIDNSQGLFKPGQFANVYVTAKSDENHIVVPTSAISDIKGKPVVFVHTSPEMFEVKFVHLGENNTNQTIILKGLEDKERVVVNGTYQVKSIYLNQ